MSKPLIQPALPKVSSSEEGLHIRLVGHRWALETCKRWHYTRGMGSCTIRFGFWTDDRYDGVIAFIPDSGHHTTVKQFWQNLAGGKTVELSRIALRPQVERESPTTRYVSMALSKLKEMRAFDLMFTYCDPSLHEGILYRACSFYQYEAPSGTGYTYVRPDGSLMHSRNSSYKTLTGGYKRMRTPLKERYFAPLTKRCRRRIERMIADGDKRILR